MSRGENMNRWLPARVLARSCFLMLAIALGVGARGHALNYELSFNKPNTHLMKITIHAGDLDGKSVAFAMPKWAPGYYEIKNFAAYGQAFDATDVDGHPLAWTKTDSQTWQIDLNGSTQVV